MTFNLASCPDEERAGRNIASLPEFRKAAALFKNCKMTRKFCNLRYFCICDAPPVPVYLLCN